MNVLVAGGTGFIGTNLCRELRDRGHDVTALARDPNPDSVPEGVETAVGDVSAYDSIVETVADHDAVVNLVSLSVLYQPPSGTSHEEVHFGGTKNLLDAAEEGGVQRFVQMSNMGADPTSDVAFFRAKGMAEDAVRESDLEWTIFCPSVVFGDGGEFVEFTKKLTTPYLTILPGGGNTPFQPIWVGDLVSMLADALEDDRHVGERYEIGGPDVFTLKEVTKLAYRAEGRSVTVFPVPMALAKLGSILVGPVPFVPFGPDQVRSLKLDDTVTNNDVTAFDRTEADLRTLEEYLGLSGSESGSESSPSSHQSEAA
ncbi:complex I NDUFA9 subunit family protein [Natronosalvus halobius]|uniref:complex I NDUFA9 subunit family protein n=1 Tax=Natronosalvus halobius TaxID=2953746 RepID=UPI00209DC7B1|nr:complex I NDUFA9 subunit family protein [Natronosalvus halobius]USZ73060.1 complex I NDUFA9 subunit family protein [Natronosalvus halobius]